MAREFKVGDKLKFTYNGKKRRGIVVDSPSNHEDKSHLVTLAVHADGNQWVAIEGCTNYKSFKKENMVFDDD